MSDGGGSDAGLAQSETAIGYLPNRDAKRSLIKAWKRAQHGSHDSCGAAWPHERQRRSAAALVLAENDGIEKKMG